MNDRSESQSRRSLLKRMLISGGALALPGIVGPGLLKGATPGRENSNSVDSDVRRLGLLLPKGESRGAERLSDAVRRGISKGLQGMTSRPTLVERERVTNGYQISDALEDLVHIERADAILCFANTIHAESIAERATALRRPVILIDSGINPVSPGAFSPWLQVHTADLFDRLRVIAATHATDTARTALVLLSSYESGFQGAEAIRVGFEERGGKILGYFVTDRPGSDREDLSGLQSLLDETGPDIIFSLHENGLSPATERIVRRRGSSRLVQLEQGDLTSRLYDVARDATEQLLQDNSDVKSGGGAVVPTLFSYGATPGGVHQPYGY